MNTTQIFVEQLLIGLFVIVLGYAIVHGGPSDKPADAEKPAAVHITAAVDRPATVNIAAVVNNPPGDDKNSAPDTRITTNTDVTKKVGDESGLIAKIEFGTLFLAFAYFIGIAYDRISDTLLQDFERHNRLRIAQKEIRRKIVSGSNDDPFPIHKIRLKLLRDQPAVVAHADYLRSRMRVSRSFATLVPLVPLSVVMYRHDYGWPFVRGMVAVVIIGIYLAVLILKINDKPEGQPKTTAINSTLCRYMRCHLILKKDDSCDHRLILRDYLREPLTLAVLLLAALTYNMSSYAENEPSISFLYFLAVIVMTLAVGWVWWRISETYNKFLLSHYNDSKESPAWSRMRGSP